MAICFNNVEESFACCFLVGNSEMEYLPGLDLFASHNLNFTWVRSVGKIFQIPKTWFNIFTWVGTATITFRPKIPHFL